MIKVSVFYPNEEGKIFDMEYYLNKHGALLQEKLGAALKGVTVEQGLGGAARQDLQRLISQWATYISIR